MSEDNFEKEFQEELKKDLNNNFEASSTRLNELRAGRDNHEIPLSDEYWKALNKHRTAHNK